MHDDEAHAFGPIRSQMHAHLRPQEPPSLFSPQNATRDAVRDAAPVYVPPNDLCPSGPMHAQYMPASQQYSVAGQQYSGPQGGLAPQGGPQGGLPVEPHALPEWPCTPQDTVMMSIQRGRLSIWLPCVLHHWFTC